MTTDLTWATSMILRNTAILRNNLILRNNSILRNSLILRNIRILRKTDLTEYRPISSFIIVFMWSVYSISPGGNSQIGSYKGCAVRMGEFSRPKTCGWV